MEKILISACLLGRPVRYDGNDNFLDNQTLGQWKAEGRLVSVCPEADAGMGTPRPPAEIINGDGFEVLEGRADVINLDENKVTDFFITGAQIALALCKKFDIKMALLTESSPSCGSTIIYNGEFKRKKISGVGVTTALLQQHGVQVFNQHSITEAKLALEALTLEK
jgi:uncharacterized protein YbbK (DUF523 family)